MPEQEDGYEEKHARKQIGKSHVVFPGSNNFCFKLRSVGGGMRFNSQSSHASACRYSGLFGSFAGMDLL